MCQAAWVRSLLPGLQVMQRPGSTGLTMDRGMGATQAAAALQDQQRAAGQGLRVNSPIQTYPNSLNVTQNFHSHKIFSGGPQ